MKQPSLRDEIAGLRAEVEQLRRTSAQPGTSADPAEPEPDDQPDEVHKLFGELSGLVQTMIDEAEESFTEHPVAAISGALALGIVIGRLTAR